MLLDVALASKAAFRILLLYAQAPGAGYTREDLRRHTMLGNRALSSAISRLCAFGILAETRQEHLRTVYRISDRERLGAIFAIFKHTSLPYFYSLVAREFAREAADRLHPQAMYLFGSVAKGTYRDDSDIDFAVVLEKKTPGEEMELANICERVSGRFKRKVQGHIITEKEMGKTGISREILRHAVLLGARAGWQKGY